MKRSILFIVFAALSVFVVMFDHLGIHEFLSWFIGPLFTFLIRVGFIILWIDVIVRIICTDKLNQKF